MFRQKFRTIKNFIAPCFSPPTAQKLLTANDKQRKSLNWNFAVFKQIFVQIKCFSGSSN